LEARRRGRLPAWGLLVRELFFLACDVAIDRINTLYSHRTFHGRTRPNPGVVRPPNMGKREWFQAVDNLANVPADDQTPTSQPARAGPYVAPGGSANM
jgi:hypothetical protein